MIGYTQYPSSIETALAGNDGREDAWWLRRAVKRDEAILI